MDPVVSGRPGPCPKCGMALEPRTIGPAETNPELEDMERRFRGGLGFTVPLFLIAMGHRVPGMAKLAPWTPSIDLALAPPVASLAARPVFVLGARPGAT